MGNTPSNIITKCKFTLTITNEYELSCKLTTEEGIEIPIFLNNSEKTTYPGTITFDMNEIIVGEQRENTIVFFKDWVRYPKEYREYPATFQTKEYKLLQETLFALLMYQFKMRIG